MTEARWRIDGPPPLRRQGVDFELTVWKRVVLQAEWDANIRWWTGFYSKNIEWKEIAVDAASFFIDGRLTLIADACGLDFDAAQAAGTETFFEFPLRTQRLALRLAQRVRRRLYKCGRPAVVSGDGANRHCAGGW